MQNFLKNKNFLILGGSGFVGKSITQKLLTSGSRIVVFTRNSNKIKSLQVSRYPGQLEIVSGNIFEDGLLELLIKDKFAVINLCGVLYEKNKNEFNTIHNFLPDMISKLCKKHNVKKFVHISALGVSKESSSNYSVTKALGEEKIKKNFKSSIILRPSIIYGKGDNFFGLFSKISKFAPVIPIIGPNTMFQPVFVNDVSLAIIEALKINENKSKTFNICGSKQYSFYQLIKILLSYLERKRILIKVNPKLMMLPGLLLQNFPNPPFTYDQMKLLLKDNVSDGRYPELEDLKIKPVLLETKLKELIDFYS
tara:strand:- start:390 stop:1316 length:927 start_codon:yes stop_codon:yes gene_type:complete